MLETPSVETVARLVRITGELFGGKVSMEESFNPEFPDDKYTVVAVETSLEPKEIVKAELEWVAARCSLAPDWHSVCLSIRPIS